jgi:hypothetical protein
MQIARYSLVLAFLLTRPAPAQQFDCPRYPEAARTETMRALDLDRAARILRGCFQELQG